MDLTFGEQIKIILSRKGMTIKELAETIEKSTGKKMSRQNLTQRLGRDNFQEQDMRMIAGILGCPFHLNILDESISTESVEKEITQEEVEIYRESEAVEVVEPEAVEEAAFVEEVPEVEETLEVAETSEVEMEPEAEPEIEPEIESQVDPEPEEHVSPVLPEKEEKKPRGWRSYLPHRKKKSAEPQPVIQPQAEPEPEIEPEPVIGIEPEEDIELDEAFRAEVANLDEEDLERGDINPYTGHEYKTNSVRMHPSRIGYVQVYSRGEHQWTDMTEWAFLAEQERKKLQLGRDYEPPIYLD